MSTYFETVKKSYADVPVTEKGVDTSSFLEATEGLIKLFDLLGNSAFVIVQNDMKGNVKKIQDRFLSNPVQNETLEELVKGEGAPGDKKRTATEGLMWLLRGLDFTAKALRRSVNDKNEELATSFSKAYEGSLRQYHNFVVKGAFALAMKACPYRQDFFAKLGSPPEKVDVELHKWLDALEKIVKQLQDFYTSGNYAKGF
ncbi:putative het-c2 protein [Meira miltonrushii]|uniref:Putative het-c2 protein n=1 Tax=Meira miltonrushii TaxID=1280837 RepID=A0A316VI42_9BASI|nr:putative het-c2 protein [Meira miltonrushii]PWN35993.1 putative het-c2 protein [Meira miltonrushii]